MQIIRTLAVILLAMGVISAQQILPAGHYEGLLKAPDREVSIAFDLDKTDKQVWIGSFDINIPNFPKGLLVDNIKVDAENISWQLKALGDAMFKGKLSAEQKTLSGTATTPGGDVPFEMKRTGDAKVNLPPPSTPITKDIVGAWEGTVDMGQPLRLIATFATDAEGKGTGDLVSVDQGGVKIPISTVTQEGSKLKFEIRAVAGSYAGALNEAKTEITGEWSQMGQSAPLNLKKKTESK